MKKIIITMLLIVASAVMYAQDDNPVDSTQNDTSVSLWFDDYVVPKGYDKDNFKLVEDKNSVCNRGIEPFREFAEKFRKSEKFRRTRVTFSWEYFSDVFNPKEFKSFKKNNKNWCSFGAWYGVSENQVLFMINHECYIDGEYAIGSSLWYRFQRKKDGKWYCIDLFVLN